MGVTLTLSSSGVELEQRFGEETADIRLPAVVEAIFGVLITQSLNNIQRLLLLARVCHDQQ